ncbi:hypothetical protein ACOMHN_017090 [Nucella lapillus]
MPLMQLVNAPSALTQVDKLCNMTQVFVPAINQAAAAAASAAGGGVPDLSQLGSVALTPLGIQQMWNSLNSLQLQQLQTLQLQQLVFQQLQGCIPHQVTAVDPSLAQPFPAQFFTHLQQPPPGASSQTHSHDSASEALAAAAAAAAPQQQSESMDTQTDHLHVVKDLRDSGNAPPEVTETEEPSVSEIQGVQFNSNSSAECTFSDVAVRKSSASTQSEDRQTLSTSASQTALKSSASEEAVNEMSSVQKGKSSSSDSLRSRLSSKGTVRGGTESSQAVGSSVVNGDCSSAELPVAATGRSQRALRRALESRCASATPSRAVTHGSRAVTVAGVVMTSPAQSVISQGSVKT